LGDRSDLVLGFVMMNSETGGSKPSGDDTEVEDFGNMDETAVLDNSAGPDGDAFDDELGAAFENTTVLPERNSVTDNVGDVSVEINVEELIADIEASEDKDAARKKEIRRRLEEAVEDRSLEDTYAIDLGEDAD